MITMLDSNESIIKELGARVRSARIAHPLTQAELAVRAGVSVGTIANLERGKDVSLSCLLNVMRALGILSNVEALVPSASPRPSDVATLGHARKRASSANARKADAPTWVWGDER